MLAVVIFVAAAVATAAEHDRCAEGRCDVQNLLQKSTATKLELEQLPNTCTFDDGTGGTFPEEPWPCGVDPVKFAPLQALNNEKDADENGLGAVACENQASNISVLDISGGGGYTPVCFVQGYCLNACSISPIDNFLYCQADNDLPNGNPARAVNSLVRITCPGLSSVTSFDPPFQAVNGRVCYVGGRYGGTVAASFDIDGSYYWRQRDTINKLTDTSLKSFSVSTDFISSQIGTPPTVFIATDTVFRDLLDFVIVKEDLLGQGIANYLVGCGKREVIILNVDTVTSPISLAMTLTDGRDTGNSQSGAQWYYHGTSNSFCAYNSARGVVSVLFDEINLVSSTVLGALVSESADTTSNDGMNCLLADPAPFPPPDRVTCPNGEEEFTFADSPTGQLAVDQNLSDNIYVSGVDTRVNAGNNQDCLGAAILTSENAAASAADQVGGAPLLIFSSIADNAAGEVGPCATGSGNRRPRITLSFRQPVDIVSFELWNNFAQGASNRAEIFWEVEGSTTFGQLNTVQGPPKEGQTVDISGASPLPIKVTRFQIWYGDLPGLKSFRFCKQGGSDVGDPHIHTLDGRHYTLLRQGTFLLWSFSHHTQIPSYEATAPVEWQLYAHYSGHASYTKGLLLLDTSLPSLPHALELTANDCKWRSRKGTGHWAPVEKPELLMVQTGADYVTGMNVLWNSSTAKDYQLVKLNMNSLHGIKQMATLHISCRPNHNINTAIVMERAGDSQFVRGQVGVTSKRQLTKRSTGISALQTAQDQEFLSEQKWTELGGSSAAAMYLNSVDEQGASFTQRSCSDSETADASEICTKHLGKPKHHEMRNFADCVYDVCTGGGEIAAQLMAVVMKKSKE